MQIERKFVRVLSLFVMSVAALVLVGWVGDVTVLKSVIPNGISMKANTAVCLLLSAGGIYYYHRQQPNEKRLYTIAIITSLLIALLTMLEYVFNTALGIDELLFKDVVNEQTPYPGRMAFITTICIALLNVGHLGVLSNSSTVKRISQGVFHLITIIAAFALFGHIFRVPGFYTMTFITGMAINTALMLLLLSVVSSALLPDVGYARLFHGNDIGSLMAKRLFPVMFAIVIVLGALWFYVYTRHALSVEIGAALYALSFILASLLLIRNTANRLNTIDAKRKKAEGELRNLNAMLEEEVEIRTRELKKSNMRNQIFVNEAPTAIAMFDANMCYVAASQKWISDYGLQGMDIIGKSHYDIFPEIGEDWKQIHRECLAGAVNKNDDAPFLREDGSEQWLAWDVRPWYASEGQVGGIIMYTEDITARKKTAQQLVLSESQFRGAFEASPTGIAIISLEGKWVTVNAAISTILGYTAEELLRLTFQDITHPDDIAPDVALVNELLEGKRQYYQLEKRYKHKNGEYIWAILSVSLVRDAAGNPKHFVSQITDINTQRITQNKLAQTLDKLEGILNASTQVSIISTDVKGVITSFNVGAENLLGYSREEMLHAKTPGILHIAEEMEARGAELSAQLGKTVRDFDVFTELPKVQPYETREWTYVRKDGTQFPVQLTVTAVREKGEIVGYLGIAADISEIKRVEREIKSLLDVTNAQNERLRNFAHIVSHNLRSHSGNISILLDLFLQENEEKAEDELLKNLLQSANNLRDTIVHLNEVVVMNNAVGENLKPIHLRSVVDAAIQNIRAIAQEKNVRIENDIDDTLYVAGVDAYMDSIVLNFLTNGIKYKSDDREAYVRVHAIVKDGTVELEFTDNGIGMDLKRMKHKLFGMYKTFHGNDDARGIGLFITKNQVEAMGGRIEVESEENKGTSFKVYLRYAQKD